MGGIGSSRWKDHQKARLVTDAMALDLRDPQLKTLLASDRAEGTLRWSDSCTGSLSGWADFILAPINPDGIRNLVLDRTSDEFEPKQLVALRLRPAGFSAHWFAGCRSCDRWVRTLFAISQSDRFTCRVCSNLTYRGTQTHDSRLDLARRDPERFLQSRARAPKTVRSQLVTAALILDALDHGQTGRGWGRGSVTSGTRFLAAMQREWEDRWGRPFPTLENPLSNFGIDE